MPARLCFILACLILPAAILALVGPASAAPTISPDLAAEIAHAAPSDRIPVMIVMREQANCCTE